MKPHKPPFILKEIKLEVTYKCPLACIHCSSDATPASTLEMEPSQVINILEQACELGVKEVVFSGGEPLLWDGIEEAITFSHSKNINTSIYTSGNVTDIESRLKKVFEAGNKRIILSLFGDCPESHERITRIRGSYQATINASILANKIGFNTEFHFVPFPSTYLQLDSITRMARSLGVLKISVLRFVPQGRGQLLKQYTLNTEQNMKLREIILSLRSEGFDVRTGSPYNFLMLNNQPECYSAIDRIIVGPDMRIYPCDAFKQIRAEEIVGTLEYSDLARYSLLECWEKSPYLSAIRNYLTTNFAKPCVSCDYLEHCLSGCLAQKVIAYGSMKKKKDPMCIRPYVEANKNGFRI